MSDLKKKLNKPLIIVTFIILVWMGILTQIKEKFHMNTELSNVFDASPAGTAAKWAFMLMIFFGSFIGVYLITMLWNNLLPRITNWKEINYWEAMGMSVLMLLFSTF